MSDTTPAELSAKEQFTADFDRHTIIFEARTLVKQLDVYLELIGQWVEEGWGIDEEVSGDAVE